jgi:hypothetical protein
VNPGDTLSASVTANGLGSFTLSIGDATQGWTFTTDATARRAELGSAEWIAEAPSNGRRPLPLANFGSVTFTQCTANSSPVGANASLDEISMADRGGTVQAQPSDLSADGTGFSIAWSSSGGSASGSTGSGSPPTQPYPGHHHHWHDGSGGGWGGWGQGVVIDL